MDSVYMKKNWMAHGYDPVKDKDFGILTIYLDMKEWQVVCYNSLDETLYGRGGGTLKIYGIAGIEICLSKWRDVLFKVNIKNGEAEVTLHGKTWFLNEIVKEFQQKQLKVVAGVI